MLANTGLPAGPLAAVRLKLARVSTAGRWHLDLASTTMPCARLARATARGRTAHTASDAPTPAQIRALLHDTSEQEQDAADGVARPARRA